MFDSDHANRRRQPREPAGYLVQVQPRAPESSGVRAGVRLYVARDVSRDGISLWVDFIYPLHARLLVTFGGAGTAEDTLVSRIGAIVWVDLVPTGGRHRLGIRFSKGGGADR